MDERVAKLILEALRGSQTEQTLLRLMEAERRKDTSDEALPKPLNLLKIASMPPPSADWVVKDLIPVGVVSVLIGEGGVGKSWFSLYLSLVISTALLNDQLDVPHPQKVCIFNFEDPPEELCRRLHYLLKTYDGKILNKAAENLFVYALYGQVEPLAQYGLNGNPETTNSFDLIRRIIAEKRPRLVILDTLSRCFGLSENSNEDVSWFLTRLEGLTRDFGCSILIVHHQHKQGKGDRDAKSSRGATALTDNARLVLTVTHPNDDEKSRLGITQGERVFRIDAVKSNYSFPHDPMYFIHYRDAPPEPLDGPRTRRQHLVKSVVEALSSAFPDGATITQMIKDKEFRDTITKSTKQSFAEIERDLKGILDEAVCENLVEAKQITFANNKKGKIYCPKS